MNKVIQSSLIFEHNNIENLLLCAPSTMFRYFTSKQARDSFLAGNIWFAGPNQNRFFATEYGGVNDNYEYRTDHGTFIGEYALSFSSELLDISQYNVELFDAHGLVQHIIESIKSNNGHIVSWLDLNKLQEYVNILPQVVLVKNMDVDCDAVLHISGVGGRRLLYENKILTKGASYNSVETARRSRNANEEFSDENEFRFYLQTGSFLSNHNINGVEYLKLNCPKIANFCRAI